MTLSEQRAASFRTFQQWCRDNITGDEKGQAQLFLDRFFVALGHKGLLEVGGAPEFRIKKDKGGVTFADFVWKPHVVIEMKRRGTKLQRHFGQIYNYWRDLVPNRPRYAVLCNFDEFWIFDFEKQMESPVDILSLEQLADRWGPVAFLFPTHERPTFQNDLEAVTRSAADKLAHCFNLIVARGVDRELAQRFILQFLVALFSEDIGLLERYMVAHLLEECRTPADIYHFMGGLFREMNNPGVTKSGRYRGVDYFNGGLFAMPAFLPGSTEEELADLREAAKYDWSKVRPEIFGTLFEHSLGKAERHAFGAHFTSPADIMMILGPTIVEPWQWMIDSAKTRERLQAVLARMHTYTVLDPACGSGNFLYMAYRELKRLEARVIERLRTEYHSKDDKSQAIIGFVTAKQFYGMDINPFAVELAKVTIMIARKLSIDELHINEDALPLDNLDENFVAGDALLDEKLCQRPWPKADAIVGNPPYLGAKRLKPERGKAYVDAVRSAYPDVPGMADYCVYWFSRVNSELRECTVKDPVRGRAGLVGTQNIRNNQSRVGGLDQIARTGTIGEAVQNQPWSGDANVHVSIVNWMKTKDPKLVPKLKRLWYLDETISAGPIQKKGESSVLREKSRLNYRDVKHISSSLSDETDVTGAAVLLCNTTPQKAYQGVTPGHSGFVLSSSERAQILNEDPKSSQVIHPYMIGRELVSGAGVPGRHLIDFEQRDLFEAKGFMGAFRRVERTVLRDLKESLEAEAEGKPIGREDAQGSLERWWKLWRDRAEMHAEMSKLHGRCIVASRTQRYPFVFFFVSTAIRLGDKLQAFMFDDDYSFGILQSSAHCLWYKAKAARLKNEVDYNYSTESVFDTFPWPQSPSKEMILRVGQCARAVLLARSEATLKSGGSVRDAYSTLSLPGKNMLRDAHDGLDAAVLAAYGFKAKSDLLAELLSLNADVANAIQAGKGVLSPGLHLPPASRSKLLPQQAKS